MADADEEGQSQVARPSGLRRFAFASLRIITVAYAAILIALVLLESRLVYPGAYIDSGLRKTGGFAPMIETVQYRAADSVVCSGRLLERPHAANVVLFFHGNGTKAIWLDRWLVWLSQELDANVMAAEFRGFADSSHTPNEVGVITDCLAARDFLCDKYELQSDKIILYGQSLGGGCATAVAADGGASILILERTFDRLVDISADMYSFVPVHWLMRNRYDSVERLSSYHGPLIQLHGNADELIPIENARNLFESAVTKNKVWIEMDGIGHNDRLPESAMTRIVEAMARMQDVKAQGQP